MKIFQLKLKIEKKSQNRWNRNIRFLSSRAFLWWDCFVAGNPNSCGLFCNAFPYRDVVREGCTCKDVLRNCQGVIITYLTPVGYYCCN